jgi:AcrR family transcriptional regulator
MPNLERQSTQKPARAPQRRSLITGEKIRRVALALFSEKGVDQTTTRDISLGAGIAEGTIYRHYDSKEALIWDIFLQNYQSLAGRIEEIGLEKTSFAEQLRLIVSEFCALFDQDPELFRFLFFVQHGQLQKLRASHQTPVKSLGRLIERAMTRSEIPQQDANLATAFTMGLIMQPATFKIYDRIDASMADLAEEIFAACLATLKRGEKNSTGDARGRLS